MAELPDLPPPDINEEGVDRSLIRWFLSLTVEERIEYVEEQVHELLAIRELNARQ